MATSSLNNAKNKRNDEFYTQYKDIEKELVFYDSAFSGKIVYCNCDNPKFSNFYRYFLNNFSRLGIKKLIATYLDKNASYKYVVSKNEVEKKQKLHGNGDFRSKEALELLQEADIIVTNPPFSLFREYIDLVMDSKKSFLIIGNANAISYQNCFQYIVNDKMWLGLNCVRWFITPSNTLVEGARSFWFTNLKNSKREDRLTLTKKYNHEVYSDYDNFEAIEVSKSNDIPYDYKGIMGVPLTFLDKYNPVQFKIIGADYQVKKGQLHWLQRNNWNGKTDRAYINGKRLYSRIFIKLKEVANVV